MMTEDPRFSATQHAQADVDLLSYRSGRLNLLLDTELVLGSERRFFDLNHANVIFEMSPSFRWDALEIAGVFHHVSRHVVDREFDRVPAWHTLGARATYVFPGPQRGLDITLDYGRVVRRTFVDYTWTSQLTVRFERALLARARVFASGGGIVVGVDRDVLRRGRQTGARAEGGVRFVAARGAIDLYTAYERRVDGHPTSRQTGSWYELGFRLRAPGG